jgi:hypothetical protein
LSYSYLSSLSFSSVPSPASVQSASRSPSPPPPPPPYSSSSRAATRSSRPSSAKSATGPPLSPPPAPLSFPPSPCHGRAGGWLPAGGSGAAAGWRARRIWGGLWLPPTPGAPEDRDPPGMPYLSARAVRWRTGSPQPQTAAWLRCTDSYQRCSSPGTLCSGGLQILIGGFFFAVGKLDSNRRLFFL